MFFVDENNLWSPITHIPPHQFNEYANYSDYKTKTSLFWTHEEAVACLQARLDKLVRDAESALEANKIHAEKCRAAIK